MKINPELEVLFKDVINCAVCNNKHGGFFMVPDKDWFGVVPEEFESKILCWNCYSKIREEKGLKKLNYEDWKVNKIGLS